MSLNRSIRSNTSISGRTSPNPQTLRSDDLTNRSSSPPPFPSSAISNNRSSFVRQQDGGRSESPTKNINDDDIKFYRVGFERCADLPARACITNREKFVQALSYVGYDLPKAKIDELWAKNDRTITFKSFQRILNEEKAIDERTLEEAFEALYTKDRKHDLNAIDFDRFRTDMLEKGDRLTEDEFKKIRFLLGTTEGKVDLKKLIRNIGETKTTCRQKLLTEKKEQKKDDVERPSSPLNFPRRNNNNNNVHIIIDPSSKKLSIPPKTNSLQMKGAFFCEYFDSPTDALYFSISYTFEIKNNTPIWITLEPTTSRYHKDTSFKQLDVRLLLFEKIPRSMERRLLHISSERSGTKSYLQLDELRKGSYEIVPVTFGGVLRARSREVNERPPIKTLREKKGNKFLMSKDYREALEYVFDLFDFDDNQQLDRQEYNLWTIRTTDEEITDQDWISVRETVRLDVDENVSKEKFLKLNDLEVQDPDTSEQDLWNGLKSLGFNYALELDMMCPFNITVQNNNPDIRLKPTSYLELAEIKKILIKFLQNKGEKIKVNNSSIQCFNYQDDCGSILFVENKGSSNVRLSVQVTKTKNAALTIPIDERKPPIINIRHDSSQFIWFAHKLNNQQGMELDAIVQTL